MNKAMCLVGAGFILVGMAGPVEARLLRYQIEGKAYLYVYTRNPSRSNAHRSGSRPRKRPTLPRLGLMRNWRAIRSSTSWDHRRRRRRLRRGLVLRRSCPKRAGACGSISRPPGERPTSRKIARANSVRRLSTVKTAPNRNIARDRTQLALNAGPDGPRPIREPPSEAPRAREVTLNPAPTWTSLQGVQKPSLKSITFDLSSGIKSVQMTDGTVHEEPLDSSIVAKLGQLEPAAGSLNAFLEQVRGTRPLDITVTATPSSSSSTNQPE